MESHFCFKETEDKSEVEELFWKGSPHLLPCSLHRKGRLNFCTPQVKSSDLPTFDPLKNIFLCHCLHILCQLFSQIEQSLDRIYPLYPIYVPDNLRSKTFPHK
jgi:hypothetical protein